MKRLFVFIISISFSSCQEEPQEIAKKSAEKIKEKANMLVNEFSGLSKGVMKPIQDVFTRIVSDKALEKAKLAKVIPKQDWDPRLKFFLDKYIQDAKNNNINIGPKDLNRLRKFKFVDVLSQILSQNTIAICIRHKYSYLQPQGVKTHIKKDMYYTIEVLKKQADKYLPEFNQFEKYDRSVAEGRGIIDTELSVIQDENRILEQNLESLTEEVLLNIDPDEEDIEIKEQKINMLKEAIVAKERKIIELRQEKNDFGKTRNKFLTMKQTMYHELTHCLLNKNHLKEKQGIMSPSYVKGTWLIGKWDKLVKDLFSPAFMDDMPSID